jgi:DNA-binding XRE family transcriptional regulator
MTTEERLLFNRPIFQSFLLILTEISFILRSKQSILLPTAGKILREFGQNIRLARKRRRLSLEQVAERANIARSTLALIEKGTPGVAMSSYLQVLFVLGLEKDILRVAADDPVGRKLQDAGLLSGKRK